jgi:hypothetical protein
VTPEEARIARLAGFIAIEAAKKNRLVMTVIEQFIKRYDPEMPCHWRVECIETGRCPREIACNN